MPLFDPYTQKILLEAVGKRKKKKLGLFATTTTPGLGTPSAPSKSSSGGAGYGPSSPGTVTGFKSGPWSGTAPAAGTQMPLGADIPSQVRWGIFKKSWEPMIDDTIGKVPGLGPAAAFAAKQIIRKDLAYRYLGSSGTGEFSSDDFKKDMEAKGFKISTPEEEAAVKSAYSKAITSVGGGGPASGSRFGILGDKVAGKVSDLTNMGIDPLDFVTKAFGADAAAAHMSGLGDQTMTAAQSAGGYLRKGKRLGVF